MIKTTYTCDRCQVVQDTPEQMWHLQVVTKSVGVTGQAYWFPPKDTKVWCRKCCVELQIWREPKPGDPVAPPLTLDEQIRDIVYTEVQEALSNAR